MNDHVLIHSAEHALLLAVLHILLKCPSRGLPFFHVCTPYEVEKCLNRDIGAGASVTFAELCQLVNTGSRLRVYGETLQLSEHLSASLDIPVSALELPPLTRLESYARSPRRTSDKRIVVAYLGAAREEKGFLKLPEVISRVFAERGMVERVHFFVQASAPNIGHSKRVLDTIQQLSTYPQDQVRLVTHTLGRDDYLHSVSNADIIWVAYDPANYRLRGSAIAVDAVSFGKILLATPNTSPASLITAGGGETGVQPADLAAAIVRVANRFQHYSEAALQQRVSYHKRAGPDCYISAILDGGLAPGLQQFATEAGDESKAIAHLTAVREGRLQGYFPYWAEEQLPILIVWHNHKVVWSGRPAPCKDLIWMKPTARSFSIPLEAIKVEHGHPVSIGVSFEGRRVFGRMDIMLRKNDATFDDLYMGGCENSDSGRVRGWIVSKNDGDRSLEVALYLNGSFVTRLHASLDRPDLKNLRLTSRAHGFSYVLPHQVIRLGEPQMVELELAETGCRIPRSPLIVNGNHVETAVYAGSSLPHSC